MEGSAKRRDASGNGPVGASGEKAVIHLDFHWRGVCPGETTLRGGSRVDRPQGAAISAPGVFPFPGACADGDFPVTVTPWHWQSRTSESPGKTISKVNLPRKSVTNTWPEMFTPCPAGRSTMPSKTTKNAKGRIYSTSVFLCSKTKVGEKCAAVFKFAPGGRVGSLHACRSLRKPSPIATPAGAR